MLTKILISCALSICAIACGADETPSPLVGDKQEHKVEKLEPPTTPSALPPPQQALPVVDVHKRNFLSANVFGYYDWSHTIPVNGTVSANSASESFSGNYDVNTVPGIGISAEWLAELNEDFKAGLEFGYAYNFNRTITGVTVSTGGISTHADVISDNIIGTSLIFLNGKYSYKIFYLLAGINYPFITVQGPLSVTDQVGYQFGLGISIGDHWSVEGEYRTLNASGSADVILSGKQYTETFNNLSITSVVTALRYSFK